MLSKGHWADVCSSLKILYLRVLRIQPLFTLWREGGGKEEGKEGRMERGKKGGRDGRGKGGRMGEREEGR